MHGGRITIGLLYGCYTYPDICMSIVMCAALAASLVMKQEPCMVLRLLISTIQHNHLAQQVQFIESLTNVYVRFNRTRLKGRRGAADCRMALACLFDVLLTVCKVRAALAGQCLICCAFSNAARSNEARIAEQCLSSRMSMPVLEIRQQAQTVAAGRACRACCDT